MASDTISLNFALLLLYLSFYYILYVPSKDIIKKTLQHIKIYIYSLNFCKLRKNC